MELIRQFSAEILAGLVIAFLTAFFWFFYALPGTLKELRDFMKESKEDHQEHRDRHDVQDRLWSRQFDTVVDSKTIAKTGQYPRFKQPRDS